MESEGNRENEKRMRGKIIKGIGGFYYVHVEGAGVYQCRARGIFRKDGQKPLVGDDVDITILHEADREGSVDALLPRKNSLIRPAAANVDQVLVVFAAVSPKPNLNLLDRFLIMMARQDLPVKICFNKMDLADPGEADRLARIYEHCGCPVYFTSVARGDGLEEINALLEGKTTIVAGPSGVGKSSLTNYLQPGAAMEVGAVSRKIDRGRHTTRHTELIWIRENTYFLDTPGFSSLYLPQMKPEELSRYFPEFAPYEGNCRFQGCRHLSEPDCGVKEALEQGRIHPSRYENYCLMEEELENRRRY